MWRRVSHRPETAFQGNQSRKQRGSPAALLGPFEKIQGRFLLLPGLLKQARSIQKHCLNMGHPCFRQYMKDVGFVKSD
ncbi:unnamed protein product [Rangifer tarandus platyrhynchus]|uniref:Uncharacterized protein n=1 Tax=Rangifer tarandus platyrhynchus TaxID=3082113 RepID=A0AC59ZHB0_RANTA